MTMPLRPRRTKNVTVKTLVVTTTTEKEKEKETKEKRKNPAKTPIADSVALKTRNNSARPLSTVLNSLPSLANSPMLVDTNTTFELT